MTCVSMRFDIEQVERGEGHALDCQVISLNAFAVHLALQSEVSIQRGKRLSQAVLPRGTPEHTAGILQQFEVSRANAKLLAAAIICGGGAIHLLRDNALASDEFRQGT